MTPPADDPTIDPTPDVIPPGLELRRPDVPITLVDLAARKSEALEIIAARVEILGTLHKAALRFTHPEDHLLFKAPEEHGGQITSYLQDCGCERVRDFYGIEIYRVAAPEKILTNDPAVFHYICRGDGRCKFTGQVIEGIEGGRSSTDDFCKDKKGLELDLAVRKAARANLDGRIVRELAGLSSIPLEDLKAAWEGTTKKVEACRKGRGFGSRDERLGGRSEKAPDVDPPVCPHCKSIGQYRPSKGDRSAFYGCPRWESHKDKKFIVNADEWVRNQTANQAPTQAAPPAASSAPPSADEVFGHKAPRQPGEDG